MRPARHGRSRGQSLAEFSLLAPVFLLVMFSTIDFGGYFGTRLSVENAARAGARTAVIESESAYANSPSAGTLIVAAIKRQSNEGSIPTTNDCLWSDTNNPQWLTPSSYPPFGWSSSDSGCIGIWYFELNSTGPPTLCIQWSVQYNQWGTWSVGASPTWTQQANPPAGCVTPGQNLVVVGVGFKYSPLTPLPTIASGALITYGETELMEEQ